MDDIDKKLDGTMSAYLAGRPTRGITNAIRARSRKPKVGDKLCNEMLKKLEDWAVERLWINASIFKDLRLYYKEFDFGHSSAIAVDVDINSQTPTLKHLLYEVLRIADVAKVHNEKLLSRTTLLVEQVLAFQAFCEQQTGHKYILQEEKHYEYDDEGEMEEFDIYECSICRHIKYDKEGPGQTIK